MAMVMDQQPTFKHFCRICKKGFGCGRALGGHMRAHGIGDENVKMDDEDTSNDWDEDHHYHKLHDGPSNKRMYALRTNPNRLKSCRICENCGMEFLSWKSFLKHGKCNSSRGGGGGGYVEAADHVTPVLESDDEDGTVGARTWSKGIRSRRAKLGINSNLMNCPSTEEEDLANCLVLLSSARVEHPILVAETEESCASASKEENKRRKPVDFFVPVTDHQVLLQRQSDEINKAKGIAGIKGMFECKACKKVFNSHQALGGHRASHKKVKGCYAAKHEIIHDHESIIDEDVITHDEIFLISSKSTANINNQSSFDHDKGNGTNPPSTSKRKSKVHECSICHRIFSSGQALGGHKRCHWVTSNSPDDNTSSSIAFHQFRDQNQNFHQKSSSSHFNKQSAVLDLNLPAPVDEVAAGRTQQKINLENKSRFEVPWIGLCTNNNDVDVDDNNNNNGSKINYSKISHEHQDEGSSKFKLAKLSDLKDMKMGDGSSSPWLQVGIGSTSTNVSSDP